MRGRRVAVVLFVSLAAAVSAGYWSSLPRPPPPVAPAAPRKAEGRPGEAKGAGQAFEAVTTPDRFLRLALADQATLSYDVRPYARYLAVRDHRDRRHMRALSVACNMVSRSPNLVRPVPVAGGRLLRIDLRWYAPRKDDIREWLVLWEGLANDPDYSLLITRDTVKFSHLAVEELPRKKVRRPRALPARWKVVVPQRGRYVYPEWSLRAGQVVADCEPGEYELLIAPGKVPPDFTPFEEASVAAFEGADVLRLNPAHLEPLLSRLQAALHTEAPVVGEHYFLSRILTTVKDKGVFKEVFGGLYYDLRGVERVGRADSEAAKKDTTDLDRFLQRLGVGDGSPGAADKLFDRLRSDMRLAVFRSGVTGKPREVSMFHTLAEKEGASWGAITGDISDRSIDIGDRSFANLLNPRREAREAIFPGPNGMPVYALFNARGELQDEVPPDVANDHTIQSPHTRRLQGAESCIACHWKQDGWLDLTNDVPKLLGDRLDVFDDLSGRDREDTIDRLVGLYQGDFRKPIRRARDDLAEVVLKAAGPWEGSEDQTDVTRLAGGFLVGESRKYRFDLVTTKQALYETGFGVPEADAVRAFRLLVPARPGLEDPRVGALSQGIAVPRADWALAQGMVAARAAASPYGKMLQRAQRWFGN